LAGREPHGFGSPDTGRREDEYDLTTGLDDGNPAAGTAEVMRAAVERNPAELTDAPTGYMSI
jgi:hypothetical protein